MKTGFVQQILMTVPVSNLKSCRC